MPLDPVDSRLVYDQADPMPMVSGGRDSLRNVLSHRLHPVWLARGGRIGGRLYVRYTVTMDGRATNSSARGAMLIYNDEAAQVLKEWVFVPGRRNGKVAAVWDTVSFVFQKPAGNVPPKRVSPQH